MLPLISFAGVTSLGEDPDWNKLDRFQKTISSEDFIHALNSVYCPKKAWWEPWFVLKPDRVLIRNKTGLDQWYTLFFSEEKNEKSSGQNDKGKLKLEGIRIALDPGHIGGSWSQMEKRHFQIGDDSPVKEGDLSLLVAQKLSKELENLGAQCFLVRDNLTPVTSSRPQDFEKDAQKWVNENFKSDDNESFYLEIIQHRSELMFYRVAEIRARATKINQTIKPDLAICLHLNAAPWPDSSKQELVSRNDYHVLVNGCYMGGELAFDDQRFEMVYRLLHAWHEQEIRIAGKIAGSFAQNTPLPAFIYRGPNAHKVGSVHGVWARNLLANRLYECPVVFLEPYVMNSSNAYAHLSLGDYEGKKLVQGFPRLSLVDEYVLSVVKGIQAAFR